MKFILIFLTGLQVINTVHSFRDYPANCTAPSSTADRLLKEKGCNCTVYENTLKKALSRKKRFFVFFPGTLAAITNVCAKAILATSPRGLIQSNEVDLFYDVPTLVQGWRQPFDDYIKKMRAEKKQYEEEESAEDEKLKNVGVVNASAIPLDQYYKTSYPKPTWSQHPLNHQTYRNNVWNQNQRNFNGPYRRPNNRGSSRYYYPNSQRRNHAESRGQNGYYAPHRYYQNSTIGSNRSYQVQSHNPRKETNNKTPWHHHREYRERRDIYDHFEKFGNMIGKKLRKCILRAICEMKQQLTPEGESFINDVARILFTVPTDHDNHEDEFTQMALEENVDCARRFMVTCPHSPLEYFVTNFRPQNTQPQREPTSKEIMESLIYA